MKKQQLTKCCFETQRRAIIVIVIILPSPSLDYLDLSSFASCDVIPFWCIVLLNLLTSHRQYNLPACLSVSVYLSGVSAGRAPSSTCANLEAYSSSRECMSSALLPC